MSNNIKFEITVAVQKGRYRMQVERIHADDSLAKFEVRAGGRSIILQSNRSQLLQAKSRKSIDWKLVEGQLTSTNLEEAAFALFKVITAIEDYIKQQPTLTN